MGFESLQFPAVTYDFAAAEMIEMSIFKYIIIQGLGYLPFLILIATVAFVMSTIFTNTALAITVGILAYLANQIINSIVYQFEINFMRYFITMNWNIHEYLFGRPHSFENMSLGFSAVICMLYFIAMIIPTFIIFKKKNIKNV